MRINLPLISLLVVAFCAPASAQVVINGLGDNPASATDTGQVAIGSAASTAGINAVAIGANTVATGQSSIAIGDSSNAANTYSIAIGQGAQSWGSQSAAIGSGATSNGLNSVSLGANSNDNFRNNTVSIGTVGAERTISNVAAGTANTDAATYGQLVSTGTAANAYSDVVGATAHAYTDTIGASTLYSANTYTNAMGAATLASANSYTNGQISTLRAQMFNGFYSLQSQLDRNAKIGYAGASLALATAGIRFDPTPGKLSIGVGFGGYAGQAGLAAGIGYNSKDGKMRFNTALSASPTSPRGSEFGISAGASMTLN